MAQCREYWIKGEVTEGRAGYTTLNRGLLNEQSSKFPFLGADAQWVNVTQEVLGRRPKTHPAKIPNSKE